MTTNNEPTLTPHDRKILRDLAKTIATIAADSVMNERIDLWKNHNSLHPVRPLILVYPEGAWWELIPNDFVLCESKECRRIERQFRQTIYAHRHFDSDNVVTNEFGVNKIIHSTGWGIQAEWDHSAESGGARAFHPVLVDGNDLKKLQVPELTYDEPASLKQLERMQDLFGDILDVQLFGVRGIGYHLMNQFTAWHGLTETMMDMMLNPEFLHDAMAFLTEAHKQCLQQMVDQNLLSLNNDNTYHNSGGNGWTDELPLSGYDPDHIRPKDMWAMAESQEMAQVSPEMHDEFCLQYEKQLLEPFGLNGYGCCEDLSKKMDDVFRIPNIRRISISPWGDVEVCAEQLKGDYIFSWKAHPAHLVGTFDSVALRQYISDTVSTAKEKGCVLEIVLKDTHTCEKHPERFTEWTKITREVINNSV